MTGLSPIGPGAAAAPTYGLTGGQQAGSAANAYGGIGGLSSFNMFSPQQFQQLTSNQVMNPYASVFQTAAGGAGEMGAQGARNIFGGAEQLQQGAGNVLQTAFDPQSALYNKYLQLMQQQSNAQMAGSGVGSSPYAAGLNNQRLTDFNTTWNAQQLTNQLAGLQGAGAAQGQATNMYGPAANLAFQSGAMPFQAYNQIQQSPMAALLAQLQYGQAGAQLPQQQISDYMSLLGLQPGLSGAQNKTALTQSALQQAELAQLGAGAGMGLLGLQGLASGATFT